MPPDSVTPKGLKAGDILFKHASTSVISRAIKWGQGAHYDKTIRDLQAERHQAAPARKGVSAALDEGRALGDLRDDRRAPSQDGSGAPSKAEATDITHMALALGPDDVVEFDEGGAKAMQLIREQGHGFVRGPMSLPSRMGKTYEVYRCRDKALWSRAADKASLVWDMTHASDSPAAKGIQDKTPLVGSYGVKKVVATGVFNSKGPDVSLDYFEKTVDQWLTTADRKNAGLKVNKQDTNIQFFCSGFVMFCYLWAASEWQENGDIAGLNYALGKKGNVSPVEVYTRIRTAGQTFFSYAGKLVNLPSDSQG